MGNPEVQVEFKIVTFKVNKGGQKVFVPIDIPANTARIFSIEVFEHLTTDEFTTDLRLYGVGPALADIPDLPAFLATLTREYVDEAPENFLVTAGPGEYVYYAHQKRLGLIGFEYGDVVGGFLAPVEADLTQDGITETWYVFQSVNDDLGTVLIELRKVG